MSFNHNAPWTSAEKVDLLVNVLRSTIPDLPYFLMQVLHEKGIYPKWNDTPLPTGRSLASSQIAYEEMGRPFKQQGAYSIQAMPHIPALAPALPGRRAFTEYDPYAQSQQQQQQQQRTLQPRPPRSTDSPNPAVTNGDPGPSVIRPVAPPEPVQEPQRKKRGRPSKEEAEERDRALAAEGKVYQPKKRPSKKARPSMETPLTVRTSDVGLATINTPMAQTPELSEVTSSGKRKPKRLVHEESSQRYDKREERSVSSPPPARSPSDRLLATHRERETGIITPRDFPRSPADSTSKSEPKES